MLIIITGIGLISFVTSIIVSSFNERLTVLREDRVIQDVGKKRELTIVCGYGLLGRLVVEGLQKEGVEFVIIDNSEEMAELAHNNGYHAICADATHENVFKKLGVKDSISHVLCLTSDDIQNAFIAVNVKSLNEKIHVTARCSDYEIAQKMEFAHVDQVIMPQEIAGMMGAVYAGEPVAFEVLLTIIEEKEKTHIDEITITEGSFLHNKSIKEIDFEKLRLILLGVFRGNNSTDFGEFIFNPEDDFVFSAGDNLVCIGYSTAIANLKGKMS
jgi:voltage-gated potassium channel